MSIFSDHECGALSDAEFRDECIRMNREERFFEDHMYDDLDQIEDEEEEEEEE